jgi:hypothetical protein
MSLTGLQQGEPDALARIIVLALMWVIRGHDVRVQPLAARGGCHGLAHAYQPSIAVGCRGRLGGDGGVGCGGSGSAGGMALGGVRVRLHTDSGALSPKFDACCGRRVG